MTRYFFNVRDGVSYPDKEGTELADIAAAKREAVRFSGQLLVDQPDMFWNGEMWSMDVCDETGLVLLSLIFAAHESAAVAGRYSAEAEPVRAP